MTIAATDFKGLFTKRLIDVYLERISPTGFLRSFFPGVFNPVKEVSIEVQRGTENIAVDVIRGASNGNYNTFSRYTEQIIIPPFYHEWFNLSDLRLYDVAIGMQNATAFRQLADEAAQHLIQMQDKIERALELQASNFLETGVVSLDADTDIDYNRVAASLVDVDTAGDYWSVVATADPQGDLENAGNFLRQVGKTSAPILNVIMGSDAFNAFINTTQMQTVGDLRRVDLVSINPPQKDSLGASLHGEVSAGSYKFRIWTYPEFYDNSSGTSTPYIPVNMIYVLPEKPRWKSAFGAVPQLIEDNSIPQTDKYLIQDHLDRRKGNHEVHIKAACVVVPTAVDQVYTAQVLA